jgi:hypothetical protein
LERHVPPVSCYDFSCTIICLSKDTMPTDLNEQNV